MDMFTFLAFGKDYVGWNYEKTKDPVYLHIKQTVKPVGEDRPSKKPTLLAIGTVIVDVHLSFSWLLAGIWWHCFSSCFWFL